MTEHNDRPALPDGYSETLADIQSRVAASRTRALLRVNSELILLYWHIGGLILERQRAHGWGTRVIERLSADLRRTFPDQQGFSARNLAYMRNFAAAWPDESILQQLAAKIPWGHHQLVDDRLRHPDDAPSIGLILCREGKRLTAEYALRDIDKPMAVAEWRLRLTRELPAELERGLPTIEEIERELGDEQ